MKKYGLRDILLFVSLFAFPFLAFKLIGLIYVAIALVLYLWMVSKGGVFSIPLGIQAILMVLVSVISLKVLVVNWFLVSGLISWLVPAVYLLLAVVIIDPLGWFDDEEELQEEE